MKRIGIQRWLAVGLLLSVMLVIVLLMMPLIDAAQAYREQKADLSFRLQRQQNIVARQAQVTDNIEALRQQAQEQTYINQQTTEALASAELQTVVKTAVTDAGGQLTSTQGITGKQEDGFLKIAVRVRMTGDIEALSQVLSAIEVAVPVLIVDQLDINPVRGVRNRTSNKIQANGQLNVSFQVVSLMRAVSQP
ncbi:MAG: general secretion pathway protein GspM [Methylomonas sp.]|nr:general secretion pathway protein GspM [Methylomonas sp.]PPD22644.1 MAG: general secretion pathway protein GspM [Methylomonas sp.]PPD27956.1 MAG: general secretion pathway protein GspM [Methylomonas sp.]PPD40065.1 MAG: general secretion pathway protein GspM [Methylomonas sp.]PPD41547.1 MAG: general secretion pathway protein GspM [Methylomonas sp.]